MFNGTDSETAKSADYPDYTDSMSERRAPRLAGLATAGPVMVIGGAEDKLRDKHILARFAKLSGGRERVAPIGAQV